MNEDVIHIRMIQHYLYCPHRWGLLEIGNVWAENYYVTKANILHEQAHNSKNIVFTKNATCFHDVSVFLDDPEWNLYGILDGLEVSKTSAEKNYTIVEYKPTKPKNGEVHFDDMMQVFAQKLCVDRIFHCDCKTYFYYADVKKRVKVDFTEKYEEYYEFLKSILVEMRDYRKSGVIPKIRKGQNCSGCSMKDLCLPNSQNKNKKKKNLQKEIKELIAECGDF